jgi:DNA-directed RNA polymerase subunit RPC12/RpoP/FtsZ-binding cell division protein ZapB
MSETAYRCAECGHRWSGKPIEAREDSPRCGECQSRDVEAVPGDGDDSPVLKHQGREQRLREALGSVPGVGEAGVEYATSMWSLTDASRGPEALRDVISEIEGVTEKQARRVASAVFQVEPRERDRRPLDGGRESADESGTSSRSADNLTALIRAREAGLIGGEDSGVDSAEVAEAVAEAINPALRQMANAQASLAEDEDGGEIQALREEIEDLRESRRRDEIEELREEISRIEGETDSEITRLKETRDMLESAPSVSAEAADAWSDTLHGLLDRLKSMERQQEIWSPPGAGDDRGPDFEPPHVGRGGRGATAQAPRQRPAPAPGQQPASPGEQAGRQRPASAADGGTPGGEGRPQAAAGGDGTGAPGDEGRSPAGGDDAGGEGGEPTDAEEKNREIRKKLGLSGGDSS